VLDSNNDFKVDLGEMLAFAYKEGLDEAFATDDFSTLDKNGDGVLDAAELLQVLGARMAPLKPSELVTPKSRANGNAAVRSPPADANQKQPDTKTSQVDSTASGDALQFGSQNGSANVAVTTPPPEIMVPQGVGSVKPTPVERMVKHFAQVLRNADVIPVLEDRFQLDDEAKAKLREIVKQRAKDMQDDSMELSKHHAQAMSHVDDTWKTVQSAATEVAEQLSIAEKAEERARALDRTAVEARGNATSLVKLTIQEALNSGADAAHKKSNEFLTNIAKFQDQAQKAQAKSSSLHARAKLETEQARELMAVAGRSLAPSI
jgi:hypothetical protein